MESISRLFDLFMYGALVVVVLGIIGVFIWLRWRAAGQERGI